MAVRFENGKYIDTDSTGRQWVLGQDTNGQYSIRTAEYKPPAASVPTATDLLSDIPKTSPVSLPAIPRLTMDPLLSPDSILSKVNAGTAAASAPVDVSKFIAPQVPILTEALGNKLNADKAAAQSDFLARGITGSSSEIQTLTRDLPAASSKALAEGLVKLSTDAIPLAQREKELTANANFQAATLSNQLRSTIGTEQFNQLSLEQKQKLSEADMNLQRELKAIDVQFEAKLNAAKFAFEAAQNEEDRRVADAQFQQLLQARKQARQGTFFKGLTTLVGTGIGAYYGGPAGAAAGATAGAAAGDSLGFLMD